MKNKLIRISQCLLYIIPIVIVFLYVITPFMRLYVANNGHDMYFHLFRIREIEEAIRHFKFPIYISDVKNVTSIDPIFYPYIFLYIPAIIDLFVNDVNVAINIFNIIILFLFFTIAYYSAYTIAKNHFVSAIFSILYPTCFYNLYNMLANMLHWYLCLCLLLPYIIYFLINKINGICCPYHLRAYFKAI